MLTFFLQFSDRDLPLKQVGVGHCFLWTSRYNLTCYIDNSATYVDKSIQFETREPCRSGASPGVSPHRSSNVYLSEGHVLSNTVTCLLFIQPHRWAGTTAESVSSGSSLKYNNSCWSERGSCHWRQHRDRDAAPPSPPSLSPGPALHPQVFN